MSLLVATAAYLIVDLVYGIVRMSERYPSYGRRGRIIETALVTTLVVGSAWIVAPRVLDPYWAGVVALPIYGLVWALLFIVTALIWVPMVPFFPLAISGLAFLGLAISLDIVNDLLGLNMVGGNFPFLSAPYLACCLLAVSAGTYFVLGRYDRDPPLTKESVREAINGSSTDDNAGVKTPVGSTTGGGDVEPVATEEVQNSKPSSRQNPTQSQLQEMTYDWRYSPARFDDIGGYNDVKTALRRRIIDPLQRRGDGDDRYSRFGIEPERGIVLYGPPGTGKTLFARALAGELTVPFVELSPADVTSMWINESSDQVKVLFDEAQELGPCVIFLDEAEHLFGGRDFSGRSSHAEDRKVTSEFLAQLSRENREAIVVAATNRPDDIDPAILRPGRLSEHFEIGLPDEESRAAILQTHLEDVPTSISDADYAELASRTAGLTGADLANLVEDARWNAANRDARTLSREDFPTNSELEAMVAEFEPETDDLPDPDENGADHLEDVDIAARSDNDDGSDDSPVGYQ
jgi:cell division protease FtsH